jgi:hypothetical protein
MSGVAPSVDCSADPEAPHTHCSSLLADPGLRGACIRSARAIARRARSSHCGTSAMGSQLSGRMCLAEDHRCERGRLRKGDAGLSEREQSALREIRVERLLDLEEGHTLAGDLQRFGVARVHAPCSERSFAVQEVTRSFEHLRFDADSEVESGSSLRRTSSPSLPPAAGSPGSGRAGAVSREACH